MATAPPAPYEFDDTPKAFQRLMRQMNGTAPTKGSRAPHATAPVLPTAPPATVAKAKKKPPRHQPPIPAPSTSHTAPPAPTATRPRFGDVVQEPPKLTAPKKVFKRLAPYAAPKDFDALQLDTDLYELGIDYDSLHQ